MNNPLEFTELENVLEIKTPALGEQAIQLDKDQIETLRSQFAPFMEDASRHISRQLGETSPIADILVPDVFSNLQTNTEASVGDNFVVLNEKVSDGGGRSILWFKDHDYFIVQKISETPAGEATTDFQIEVPFSNTAIKVSFPPEI